MARTQKREEKTPKPSARSKFPSDKRKPNTAEPMGSVDFARVGRLQVESGRKLLAVE